jgi:hypothetical protein
MDHNNGFAGHGRRPWTADQPHREIQVGLPADAQAVMVFADHLECISLNEILAV